MALKPSKAKRKDRKHQQQEQQPLNPPSQSRMGHCLTQMLLDWDRAHNLGLYRLPSSKG